MPDNSVHGDVKTQGLRWWRRRHVISIVLLLAVAVTLSGLLFARHQAGKDRLAVGDSRRGDYSISDGSFYQSYRFLTPSSSLLVTAQVGHRASLMNDKTYEFTRVKAPQDGQLVHVEWTVSGAPADGMLDASDHTSRLAVRSKKSSVVVDPAIKSPAKASYISSDNDDQELLVALPGRLDDLQLTLTFQGRTQSVSLASGRRQLGSFSSLYRPQGAGGQVSIERDQPADVTSDFRWYCDAQLAGMSRAPYLDGLGWAAAGREWAVVTGVGARVSAQPAEWSDGDHLASYDADGDPKVSVRVNGTRPVKALKSTRPTQQGALPTRDYAFSIAAGEAVTVDVDAVVPAKRAAGEDRHAPARTTVRVSNSLTLPAVVDPAPRGQR